MSIDDDNAVCFITHYFSTTLFNSKFTGALTAFLMKPDDHAWKAIITVAHKPRSPHEEPDVVTHEVYFSDLYSEDAALREMRTRLQSMSDQLGGGTLREVPIHSDNPTVIERLIGHTASVGSA